MAGMLDPRLDDIPALKDKLTKLEAESEANKDRRKLELALLLCGAHAKLDLRRGANAEWKSCRVGPSFATSFGRTTPAAQRCK